MSTSRSLNKAMLIGNLTRDPVIKVTPNGSSVCSFGVATNTTWKSSDGELQERTEFHNVVAWNKLGEICATVLSVGMLVYLEGELRTRVWEDANGIRHYKTEVKIDEMKLLDNKGKKGIGVEEATAKGNNSGDDEGEGKGNNQDTSSEEKGEKEEKEEKKKENSESKKDDKKKDKAEDLDTDDILF